MKFSAQSYLIIIVVSSLFTCAAVDAPFISLKGYIKSDLWWDSRQVEGARQDHTMYYPRKKLLDSECNDINDKGQFHTVPIQTRLRAEFSGVDALDARVSAVIEGDFRGRDDATVNLFWLRHAYGLLEWGRTNLLFGYTWHPLFVLESYADPLMFGSGLPFEAFSRAPQIRVRHSLDTCDIIAAMGSQIDFTSTGVDGYSSIYARNAAIPWAHVQAQLPWDEHLVGVGIDFKVVRPRLHTCLIGDDGIPLYAENERIASVAGMAFAKLEFESCSVKAKVLIGQNMTDFSMIGGYAVKSVDPVTDRRTYTNTATFACWTDIESHGHESRFVAGIFKPGLFVGFTQNLGAGSSLADLSCFPCPDIQHRYEIIYGRGADIDCSLRCSPRLIWDILPIRFAAELILDRTAYGTINQEARVVNTIPVYNMRFLLGAYYFF